MTYSATPYVKIGILEESQDLFTNGKKIHLAMEYISEWVRKKDSALL
jgi:hypothetical protein